MNAEQLSRVGEKLVKRCGSRDPFEIARQLGINVMLCENFGSLKGMYRVIKRNRFIFLNNSLDENMLRIVCAHELGHDQLHRNMAKTTPIHEFMLYDMKSKPEYEANIVAAGPGRKFCVSDIRQSQEYHVINVHIWGLFPLVTAFPGGWGGMRAEGRECRHGLPGTLFQGDQPTLRSANMMSS